MQMGAEVASVLQPVTAAARGAGNESVSPPGYAGIGAERS
jgi:hypothetical protein